MGENWLVVDVVNGLDEVSKVGNVLVLFLDENMFVMDVVLWVENIEAGTVDGESEADEADSKFVDGCCVVVVKEVDEKLCEIA